MGFFRSEEMQLFNLVMPRESAWTVLNALGQLNTIHFIDYDESAPQISRPYANQVKRCDEIVVKIQFLQNEIQKFGKIIHPCEDEEEILLKFNQILRNRDRAPQTYIESIETSIQQQADWLTEQLKHFEHMVEEKNYLIEERAVILKSKQVLGKKFFTSDQEEDQGFHYQAQNINLSEQTFEQISNMNGISMKHLIGVIDESDSNRFKRMVFRVTKGNVWTDILQIDKELLSDNEQIIDPTKRKETKKKVVFVILYPGGALDSLQNKLTRLCDSFGASRYQFPQNTQQFTQKLQEIDQRLSESKDLVEMTEKQILEFLDKLCGFNDEYKICSQIEEVRLYVQKEKSLYQTMNLLKIQDQFVSGNCWIPLSLEQQTQKALQRLSQEDDNNLPIAQLTPVFTHKVDPPTYIPTNEFTAVFQQIVDTYGVPRYKEVNPGLFTCITFPFLFGVMYGDIGHGFGLLAFGLFLVFRKNAIKNDPFSSFKSLVETRYLITLMGFFAFYCGFIYNDFLSLKLNLFGSCYEDGERQYEGYYLPQDNCVYPLGMDPAWAVAKNELGVNNSLKMKLAVILGVLQMMFGISLKAVNALHLNKKLDLFFEFIPQIVFMGVTFFYMDIMIIIKWFTNYYQKSNEAPSIISFLINMPLKGGDPGEYPLYGGQHGLQAFLFTVALLCIPLMLIPKPVLLYYQQQKKTIKYSEMFRKHGDDRHIEKNMNLLNDQDHKFSQDIELQKKDSLQLDLESELEHGHSDVHEDDIIHSNHEEEESFGELFVHQIIETIEFVLGSISNTASYLRLWALSLAHSQLAKVFLDKILKDFIEEANVPGIVIGFSIFYLITFGVLMCMDVMECFLHALRLHWVEFQNKFYKADGYKFQPFSFIAYLKDNQYNSSEVTPA